MTAAEFWFALALAFVGALVPAFIARRKSPSHPTSAFIRFYVFGVVLLAVALPVAIFWLKVERPTVAQGSAPLYRDCPFCKEQMRQDASVCPHCQRGFMPSAPTPPPS